MDEITASDLVDIFAALAARFEKEKGGLSELDGKIGDADHGITMALGFNAVHEALCKEERFEDPAAVFSHAANAFLATVGASAGPLYATAFMRAAASAKGKQTLDAQGYADVIQAMAKGIQERGKASAGEKTMLDAWLPAAETASQIAGQCGLCELAVRVAAAASAGARDTVSMKATKGRAARLGDRSIGHIDPGAFSAAMMLLTITSFLSAGYEDE